MTGLAGLTPERARHFDTRIDKTGDCWLWMGSISRDGYGRLGWSVDGRCVSHPAHRVSYAIHVGPIPDGYQLDHLCRVRHCVRPDHLEPVTQVENWRRGESVTRVNAAKTHCDYGHPFDAANTRVSESTQNGRTVTMRTCRACDRRRQAETKARRLARRAAVNA